MPAACSARTRSAAPRRIGSAMPTSPSHTSSSAGAGSLRRRRRDRRRRAPAARHPPSPDSPPRSRPALWRRAPGLPAVPALPAQRQHRERIALDGDEPALRRVMDRDHVTTALGAFDRGDARAMAPNASTDAEPRRRLDQRGLGGRSVGPLGFACRRRRRCTARIFRSGGRGRVGRADGRLRSVAVPVGPERAVLTSTSRGVSRSSD